ncbi:hypothetical protein E4U53_000365 [Claviceps sorghi]|nr:hypothetical protein E4U53_000365 [Claviceps sorghi]
MPWLVWAAATASLVGASPYPRDARRGDGLDTPHDGPLDAAPDAAPDAGSSLLRPRHCASYCGVDNQYCCDQNQLCTTLPGNIATCLAATWRPAYTTTWTVTYTSIIMTHWIPAPAPTPGVDCIPQAPEQEACGRICCAGWQQCAYKTNGGQCSPRPGYAEPTAVVVTANGQVTTHYAAPFRSDGKWWLGVAGAATTLLALLNLKKKEKPARKTPASSYYSDSYTYSDLTDLTASTASSGGRTHRTGQTARSYRSRDSRPGTSYHSHAPSRAPSRRP